MRVFWPKNCLSSIESSQLADESLLIGWENSPDDIVVVCAVPKVDLDLLEHVLANDILFDGSKNGTRSADDLYCRFGYRKLSVVGTHFTSSAPQNTRMSIGFSVCDGRLCDLGDRRSLMIYYHPPNPNRMQIFTLRESMLYRIGGDDARKLDPYLDYHLVNTRPKDDYLDLCIAQMNCVHELQLLVKSNFTSALGKARQCVVKQQPNGIQQQNQTEKCKMTHVPAMRTRSDTLSDDLIAKAVSYGPVLCALIKLREYIEYFLAFIERTKVGDYSLLALFCTAQQVHLRLNQLCYLPLEYVAISKRHKHGWHWLQPDRNDAYNRFFNHIWLFANDLLYGVYMSILMRNNRALIADWAAYVFNKFMIEQFIRASNWMKSWPAGFKLNAQLGGFIGDITDWTVYSWSIFGNLIFNKPVASLIVEIIALAGFLGGVTLQISLIVDVISLSGFHIYLLYQSMARVYSQVLSVLGSLFRLFRGLKYNMLRNRVDHGNYDIHQLFLGTILFTVSVFLLPTVFAYYIMFTAASLAIFATVVMLCIMLAFLNHFPLFPLLLRIKSPGRVPTGVYFTSFDEIVDTNEGKMHATSLWLNSKPMRLSEIFMQYTTTMNRFTRHTFNLAKIFGLLTGKSLQFQQAELYASLYSVLPRDRGSVEKMENELRSYIAATGESESAVDISLST